MRDRLRTAAAVAAVALLAAGGCHSDIKEQQADDSVGAYEPAAGPGTVEPTGGPLPVPVDTNEPPGGRDTVGPVVNPPPPAATPAAPRTPPPAP